MAQNAAQYQQGFSMREFFERYDTQQQCEELVRSWRWPDGIVCPRCGGTLHSEFGCHDRPYRCAAAAATSAAYWRAPSSSRASCHCRASSWRCT